MILGLWQRFEVQLLPALQRLDDPRRNFVDDVDPFLARVATVDQCIAIRDIEEAVPQPLNTRRKGLFHGIEQRLARRLRFGLMLGVSSQRIREAVVVRLTDAGIKDVVRIVSHIIRTPRRSMRQRWRLRRSDARRRGIRRHVRRVEAFAALARYALA